MSGARRAVALDLGGTHFRVALGTSDGDIEWRVSKLTEVDHGPQVVLQHIYEAVDGAISSSGGRSAIAGIAVAAPGPLDPWAGVIYDPPNLPGWDGMRLKDLFEERYGVPALVGNDANLAAVGEHRYGAGRGLADVVYVTVSTGIGGGVIADNRLLLGVHGFAGEVGHMTIDMRGPVCGCGNHGCLEALASGTAIGREARDLVRSGRTTSLAAMAPEELTAKTVTAAAYAGDQAAAELLRDAGTALGVGIANIANLFNPSRVILGGGVAINAGAIFWDAAMETARIRALPPSFRDFDIVPAGLGDDAGLLGGIAVATDPRV